MKSVYEHSHFGGNEILSIRFPAIKTEIAEIICDVKLPPGGQLRATENIDGAYPTANLLDSAFSEAFTKRGYQRLCDTCAITRPGDTAVIGSASTEVSAWKERVLVDVQFGEYAAMFFSLAKLQLIFSKDQADVGVIVLPCQKFQEKFLEESAFGEHLIHDIERLKPQFPAIPVMVILVDADD